MKTVFDRDKKKCAPYFPESDDTSALLSEKLLRKDVPLPDLPENEVIRHYTELSRKNFGVDNGFYPLGSCTMKYNPKINEQIAGDPRFLGTHPLQDEEDVQGNLEVLHHLQEWLGNITGMEAFTLQPAAGAHGELTGLMMVKAYFEGRNEKRTKIITPDSSHGTNPATVAMCGFMPVSLKSDHRGRVDLGELESLLDEDVAAMMLTNPNTLGIFESDIRKIADAVHRRGALLYSDGANANALLGISRYGDMGYDITHLNLHKTFSTPHGGGGPGSGPVGVNGKLKDFLPGPLVEKTGGRYQTYTPKKSIGRMMGNFGNFGILLRAYTYIRALGREGIVDVSRNAVLNANWLRRKLEGHFHMKYPGLCKHEFVLDDTEMPGGVITMDIAKRLLDFGFHPPTIYFPLIVPGAMMIEPTETESMETLRSFADAMMTIKKEAEEDPELVKTAPHTTPLGRMDEVLAARKPILKYDDIG